MTTPPPPTSPVDSGDGASVVGGTVGGNGTSNKRRHSRGRSITSRAEMMSSSSRPSSAKTPRPEGGVPSSPWSDQSQVATSPPGHDRHSKETHVSSLNLLTKLASVSALRRVFISLLHVNSYLREKIW